VRGTNARLNLESTGAAGAATTFHGRVFARLPGPSGTVNFASPSSTDKLIFDSFVTVVGGTPKATVNVATANTTIDNNKLRLFSATRHNV